MNPLGSSNAVENYPPRSYPLHFGDESSIDNPWGLHRCDTLVGVPINVSRSSRLSYSNRGGGAVSQSNREAEDAIVSVTPQLFTTRAACICFKNSFAIRGAAKSPFHAVTLPLATTTLVCGLVAVKA